ncbi:conserved oligomeric Golgi complex subunit 5, putative [Babesia ovata]|uniref:Conserved oligomeric Golgi complex subunit 5, putative n=1 Tax=Babesia ovata TaxID=189622 RepID=A0A2H6KGG6_9APIC|nr:conserved oligomeric Golgi complex subunit 5, putative [Babesia ovata]GBE62092.1 conserved oligomeric Golgi complex subunit 5, putative [Babesia ovata]
MARLEDVLVDAEAVGTCNHLLKCYGDDLGVDVLSEAPNIDVAAASFLSQVAGKSAEQVKTTLDSLNHALLIVSALRHKGVLNNTSDIIKSEEEVNTFLGLLNDVSESVGVLRSDVESRYGHSISLYRALEDDIACLDGICKAQTYVVECMDVLSSLREIKSLTHSLGTLDEYATLLNTSHKLSEIMSRVAAMQKTDVSNIIFRQCEELKTHVVNLTSDKGINVLIRQPVASGSNETTDESTLKRLSICHYILRELAVAPSYTLRLVDEMVASTGRCIDLDQLLRSGTRDDMWQQFLISQLAEFMAKYKSCLMALHTFCRSVNYRLSEHLSEEEEHILKLCPLLSQPLRKQHDPLEVFAACELYVKRCVGILHTALSHLESQSPASGRFDVAMLAPQLISIGECTHKELCHLNIPFNMHAHYFTVVCERYAKEFMTNTAARMLPASQAAFAACLKVLHQNGVKSFKGLSPDRELQIAAAMVHSVPVDVGLARVMYDFIDKSHSCETLHRHVLEVANSALQNILRAAEDVSTVSGSRLLLSDGGSKISLKRPTDAHCINARIYHYILSFVDVIEPCLVMPMDKESKLYGTVQAFKNLNVIGCWSDDVGATLWHTVSYISSGNTQEFRWQAQQVLTATQNIVKICNFLRENYFDQLVQNGHMRLFRRLATHAIASFVVYALTVWPLAENDKMALLGVVTELEMALAEILKESLPKLESDFLAALRRLLYLGDELYDVIDSPDFQSTACLKLPIDVISLHVMTRVVNSDHVSAPMREELLRSPLCQYWGTNSIHTVLDSFRDTMLRYEPSVPCSPMFGKKLAAYLKQFASFESLLNEQLSKAFTFLNNH